MKAVIYHADGPILFENPYPDLYKVIVDWYRKQVNKFGMELVHLTTEGHEGWGDINYHFQGDLAEPMYNREVFFTRYLRDYANGGWHWFGEPDAVIRKMFPMPMDGVDPVFLFRENDSVQISPCFRLAKQSALPMFEEILSLYDLKKKDWYGDSHAFVEIAKRISKAKHLNIGIRRDNGVAVELRQWRRYSDLSGDNYINHYKFKNKVDLYEMIKNGEL